MDDRGKPATLRQGAPLEHGDTGSDEGLLPRVEEGGMDQSRQIKGRNVSNITGVALSVVLAFSGLFNIALLSYCVVVSRNHRNPENLKHDGGAEKAVILPVCPDGWVWYRGKCYNFSKKEGDWATCNAVCTAYNSSLAVFETDVELDFLMKHKGVREYWIGLKEDSDGIWKWVDGTNITVWFTIKGNSPCAYLNSIGPSSSRCHNERRCLCNTKDLQTLHSYQVVPCHG
ncbi:C-type lectin domain family 2 member B-like isoform X2 [Ambystoma mexicanum]|uniref:C-type lectin domain family 2 member B-like isoform X2 n=1 Tax=Ambystoma mexicanum TaxID=8296 RepID=UPI0037E9686C